jgi:glycosyltransferase involved in cell wall biosynthesis
LNVIHVLPEFEEGGVERLVLMYANGQASAGHHVYVISHGGKLESSLSPNVRHIKMPVHRKNPFVIIRCALSLVRVIREEKVSVVHAHSRVPAWICYIAKKIAPSVTFIFTAHAKYTLKRYLLPIKRADGVTCVSHSVREHLKDWLPEDDRVKLIYNPRPDIFTPWVGSGDRLKKHLLYVGRISEKKGPLTAVDALSTVKNREWTLDVLGDGPLMPKLRERVRALGLGDRIILHGFRDDVAHAISRCDLFLSPSFDEGFGLTLMTALASGAPVMASDISATRELTAHHNEEKSEELLPAGDISAWSDAIGRFLDGTFTPTLQCAVKLPTIKEISDEMIEFYEEISGKNNLTLRNR